MGLFQYFSASQGRNGNPYGFSFEHEADDLDTLCGDLTRDTVVTVTRLRTTDDGRGGRLIVGRDRIIIGSAAVGTIQNQTVRHWEPAEAEAA